MIYKILLLIFAGILVVYFLNPALFDPLLGRPSWKEFILSGKQFTVTIDTAKGKFDDSLYSGNPVTDPLGPIKGNERYTVRYLATDGFTVIGLNQASGRVDTLISQPDLADPSKDELALFDHPFTYNYKGEVNDAIYGLVGHLERVSAKDPVKNLFEASGPRWVKVTGDFMDNNCAKFCNTLGKRCDSFSCPPGPPPCQCTGGMCEVAGEDRPYCAKKWDTDCRTLIDRDPAKINLYCCCN